MIDVFCSLLPYQGMVQLVNKQGKEELTFMVVYGEDTLRSSKKNVWFSLFFSHAILRVTLDNSLASRSN